MTTKKFAFCLAMAAISLPFQLSPVAAQTSLIDEYDYTSKYEDAIDIGPLKGPFGFSLSWAQYVDRETAELTFQSGGETYSWQDIFARYTFFKVGRTANRNSPDGSELPAHLSSSDTVVRFFEDQAGVIYAAGWRHFPREEKSVFSIAPVDLSLLERHDGKSSFNRKVLDELAQDPGLSIVFQAYSADNTGLNSGYNFYANQVKGWRELYTYLQTNVQPLNAWFKTPFKASDYVIDEDFAAYLANDGCSESEFGPEFFSSDYMLSPLGRCAFAKVVTSQVYQTADPLEVWRNAQEKFLRDNKVTISSSGSIPSIKDIPDIFRFGHRWNYFPFSMYSWSSLARSACDIRTPESGDWIILRFDDRGPGAFSAYSDKDVKFFADRIYRNTDLGAGGKYPCDGLPNSLTIQVFHEEKIIAEQRVSGSQVPDRLSKNFLDEGVGAQILNYAKGL